MKNPCYDEVNHKDCPGRHAGCAVDCPAWAEYERQRNMEYQKRHAETEARWAAETPAERRVDREHKNNMRLRTSRNKYYKD